MKKSTIRQMVAIILSLAMLIPAFPAPPVSAVEDVAVLYSQKATSDNAANRAMWPTNSDQAWTRDANMYSADGHRQLWVYGVYNNRGATAPHGLPVGETMELYLNDLNLNTAAYDAIAVSLIYSYVEANSDIPFGLIDQMQVFVSTDGGATYSQSSVGLRKQTLLGGGDSADTGTSGGRLECIFYQITTEDITTLVDGSQIITNIMIKPQGDYAITFGAFRPCEIEVTGYTTQQAYEEAVPMEEFGMIPVAGDDLRQIVVEEAERVATTPWHTLTQVETICPLGPSGSATSSIYQIYLPGYTYWGPTYCRTIDVTYESFLSRIREDGEYIGGFTDADAYGMDCQTFVFDAISRVSRSFAWSVQHSVDDTYLRLMEGFPNAGHAKTTDAIISANTNGKQDLQPLYEAYAKVEPGDVVFATTGSSVHTRVVYEDAVVVRNPDNTINPASSYVTCIEQYSIVKYYLELANGNKVTVDESQPGMLEAFLAANPGAQVLYGASSLVGAQYSFTQLTNTNYVPATLAEYHEDQVAEQVLDVVTNTTAANVVGGFSATLASNYRMIGTTVTLKTAGQNGKVLYADTLLYESHTFADHYVNETLNRKLAELSNGEYELTLDVVSGPVTAIGGEVPATTAVELSFEVTNAPAALTVSLSSDTQSVQEGDSVEVQVNVSGAYDTADVEVEYDQILFDFDAVASSVLVGALNAITEDDGIVRIRSVAADQVSGGALAALVFTAKQISEEEQGIFSVKSAMLSAAEQANDEDMRIAGCGERVVVTAISAATTPEWAVGGPVRTGDVRRYNGQAYECVQSHTTQSDWTPDRTPSLWRLYREPGQPGEWIQPTGAHDAYRVGERVTFGGRLYESLLDYNVWSPAVYPAGWRTVE